MIHKELFGKGKHVMAYKGMTMLGSDTWGRCLGIIVAMIMLAGTGSLHAQVVSGSINGHDYVDLGLSVKWATCNIGANRPSDYGNYYAWGETSTKSTYTEENSQNYEMNVDYIKGDRLYDAARVNWGSTWRLPTKEEMQELEHECTWTHATRGGHEGSLITGPNGNSIFLPSAGDRYGSSRYKANGYGYYWSATPNESDTKRAYILYFCGTDYDVLLRNRCRGLSIRPVTR